MSLTAYLDSGGISCPLVFYGRGMQCDLAPHHCTLYLAIFNILWGTYAPVGGQALPGPVPPSVVNTPFIQMGYGVGVRELLVYQYVLFGVSGIVPSA